MEHLDLAGILTAPSQWNVPTIFDQQDANYLSNSRQMLEPIMEETSEDEEHALNSWHYHVENDVESGEGGEGRQTDRERDDEYGNSMKTDRNNFWSSTDSETGSIIRIELTKEPDSISERDYLCPAKRAKRCDELYQIPNSLDEDAVVLRRSNNNNNIERFLSYDCCSRFGESWSTSNSGSSNREPQRNSTGSRRFDEFYSDSDSLSYNSLSRSSSLIQFESLERQLLLQEQHSSMNSLGNSSPSLLNFDGQINDDLVLSSCKPNTNSGYNSRRGSQSSLLKRYESTDGRLHQTYYDLDKLNFDEINGPNNSSILLGNNNNTSSNNVISPINSSKYSVTIPELRSDSESSTSSSESPCRLSGNSKMAFVSLKADNEFKVRTQPPTINSYQRRGSKNSVENLSEDSGYGEPINQTIGNNNQQQWYSLGTSKSQNFLKSTEQLYMHNINKVHKNEINIEVNPVEHSKIIENVEPFCTKVKIANIMTEISSSSSSSSSSSVPLITTTSAAQLIGTSAKKNVREKHHSNHTNDLNNEKIKTETFVEPMRIYNNGNDNEDAAVGALTRLFKNSRFQPRDLHLSDDENEVSDIESITEERENVENILRHRQSQRSQTHSPSPVSSEASSVNTQNSSKSKSSTSPSSCTSATTCASAASFTWLMPQSNNCNSHYQHYYQFGNSDRNHHSIIERTNSLPDIRDEYTTTTNEETLQLNSNSNNRNGNFHSNKTEYVNIIRTKSNTKVNRENESKECLVFNVENKIENLRNFHVNTNNNINNLDNYNVNLIKNKVMFKENNLMWWCRDKTSNVNKSLPEFLNDCCENESIKSLENRLRDEEQYKIKRSSSWSSINNKYSNKETESSNISGATLDHINASYYNLSDLEEITQRRNKLVERPYKNYSSESTKSLRMDKFDVDIIVEETQELLHKENDDFTKIANSEDDVKKYSNMDECVQHVQLVLRNPIARQNGSGDARTKTLSLTQELESKTITTTAQVNKTFDQDPTNLKTSYAQSLEKCNFDPIELSSYNIYQKPIRNLPKRRFQSHITYQNKKNFVSSTPNLNTYQTNNGEHIEDDLYVSSAHTSMHQLPQGNDTTVTGKPLGILLPVGPRNSNKEVSFCPIVSKYSWQEQSSEECQDTNMITSNEATEVGTETEFTNTNNCTMNNKNNNNYDSDDELLDNADATVIFNTKNNEMISKCFHENIQQEQQEQQQHKHKHTENTKMPEIVQQQKEIIKTVNTNEIPFENDGEIRIAIIKTEKKQKADVSDIKCEQANLQREREQIVQASNDFLLLKEHENNHILNTKSLNDRENETTIVQELSNENEHENEMEVKHVLFKMPKTTLSTTTTATTTTSKRNTIEVIDNNKTTTMISQTRNVNKEGNVPLKVALTNNNNNTVNKNNSNNNNNKKVQNAIALNAIDIINNKETNEKVLQKPIVILARPLSIQLPVLSEPPRNRAHHILYASQQMLNDNLHKKSCEKLIEIEQQTTTINNKLNSNRMEKTNSIGRASSNMTNYNANPTISNNYNNNNEIVKSKFKADEKHPNAKNFLARFANGFRFSLRRNKKKLQQQQQQKLQIQQQQQQSQQQQNITQASASASTSNSDFIYIPLKGPLPYNRQQKLNANGNEFPINGNDVEKNGAKNIVETKTTICNNSGKTIVVEQKVTGKPPIPGKQYQSAQSKLIKMSSPPPVASRTAGCATITVGASRFYTFEDNNKTSSMVHGRNTNTNTNANAELNAAFLNTERSYYTSSPSSSNDNEQQQQQNGIITMVNCVNGNKENRKTFDKNYNDGVNVYDECDNNMTGINIENTVAMATGELLQPLTLTSSPSRASVLQKTQMFNNLAMANQNGMRNSSTPLQNKQQQSLPQQQQQQQQIIQTPKIGLIETNLDTHETIITGKTRSLINIDIMTPPSQVQLQQQLNGQQDNEKCHDNASNRFPYKKNNFTLMKANGVNLQCNFNDNNDVITNSLYNNHHNHNDNNNDEDEVIIQPDGTTILLKNAGITKNRHQIASVRRPHKSMEFLLDKENQKNILPPENELQKSHEQNPAALSEHQLRIQASLQRLNIPDWFRQYNPSQTNASDGAGGGAYRPGNFTRKRTQDSGRWAGLNSKTTSLSSLGSQRSDRSPLLLSPSAHSHHGGQNISHHQHYHPHHSHHVGTILSGTVIGSAGTADSAKASCSNTSAGAFSRWSTSHLNSSQISPCVSQRSSFSRGGPINSSFTSIASGQNTSAIRNSMRQPYLGWRSQEKLSQRTAHERLASSLLSQQQQNQQQQQRQTSCLLNQDEMTAQSKLPPPITPEIQSSIKEVTSAIVHYVNDQTNQQRSRSTSPNSSYL